MWMNTVIRGTLPVRLMTMTTLVVRIVKQVSREVFNDQMKKTIQTFVKIDREECEEGVDPSDKRWMKVFMSTCAGSSFT